ncbi:hypothetical protein BU17DRAFT_87289 [Hysterangium stoloniferum]|nr:hypothetical protein BU17DRAFT_87289 [Hysterangium stoloniferum]
MLSPLPLRRLLHALLLLPPLLHAANIHQSIPEDLYAFPKYRVSFLNGLPVSNETAQKWLKNGLQGGELEFLGQWHANPPKEIESGTTAQHPLDQEHPIKSDHPLHDQQTTLSPTLEHMRLGPSRSYLCLIPPAPSLPPPPSDEMNAPVTPTHSWSLLQPLSGTCLYHRQAWFTYSYCHNQHVRQFRELPGAFPHPPGGRVVEEDPEWESYTLGKSPSAESTTDGQLSVNDELTLANNLELARQGAGQRYLVQRWGDGTVCDKTGRPREIEVQFHCSMTMTDTVLFVKETRTCEYVLVIHTPRLCGEPGFKSRLEQMPEAAIRCREVLNPELTPRSELPAPRKKIRPPPPPVVPEEPPKNTLTERIKVLQRAIEKMLGRDVGEGVEDMAVFEVQRGENEGEFYIAVDDTLLMEEKAKPDTSGKKAINKEKKGMTLAEAMKAAGIDTLMWKEEFQEMDDEGDDDGDHEDPHWEGKHDEL